MNQQFLEIAREQFNLSDSVFEEALKLEGGNDEKAGDILVRKQILTESQVLEALGIQYDIPFRQDLPLQNIENGFTGRVPIQFLKKFTMVPVIKAGGRDENTGSPEFFSNCSAVIAINDPSDFQPMDDLVRILDLEDYDLVLCTRDTILSAINACYDMSRGSAEELVQNMEENGSTIISEIEATADLLDDTSDAPIIKLVNHILSQSIKARASDIHIEPYQNSFKVRYRVDGILYDLLTPPKWIQASLISRIKVMSKMNIAEKRLPQDGRLEVKMGEQDIDVRVSTIPTSFGERVVLRLLNKTSSLFQLSDLGLEPEMLRTFKEIVCSPHGIILVTGPTGSGKTTTLYAVLQSINTADINIITIEDPVEYQDRKSTRLNSSHYS